MLKRLLAPVQAGLIALGMALLQFHGPRVELDCPIEHTLLSVNLANVAECDNNVGM